MIKFYKIKEPYGFMSNFYKSRIFLWGKWWQSTEAAYQSAKTFDDIEKESIRLAKTPRETRNLGQKVQMRADWDIIKYNVMKECVLAKFVQHHDLLEQLLATGDEELIEESPVDSFWGCGADEKGQNMLGKILMEVRKELQDG